MVGQEHIVQALSNAIEANRVAHAYLFTGARGVGKTSAARILAKALNCERGTSPKPCNQCDVCDRVSAGEDIDVLEIDGASNRGIDEIRQLRQNAGVRPSRTRWKIYIIDEVHMLTREAFNALLKTLEEPPEHVKFVFCTTEPEKIPITILSRCQRFDFAGIQHDAIVTRLQQIAVAEDAEVEPEAVRTLARRSGGSMRDAQSLLDQLLAFGGKQIAASDVHAMLGTADDVRVAAIATAVVQRRPADALAELDASVREGVDLGQLVDQLMGYFRDVMVACAGGDRKSFMFTADSEHDRVVESGAALGLETVLAVLQILSETKSQLRFTTQTRILAELAVVRTCRLEDLDALPTIIGRLQQTLQSSPRQASPSQASPRQASSSQASSGQASSGQALPSQASTRSASSRPAPPSRPAPSNRAEAASRQPSEEKPVSPPAKKNDQNDPEAETPASSNRNPVEITSENASSLWDQVLSELGDMTAVHAGKYSGIAIHAPNRLVVAFPAQYTFHKRYCERPDQTAKLQEALANLCG
ncbi:MAG: DNA polymerase III subunit gamma/tau, partial [Planctomycetales bacterium]